MMGLSLDWSREFATCDPEYYHQQQKLFLDFYKAGFVYRSEADVNWDPVDMTVLANEQVIDGRGWRSGALVERRKLSQWFFKITAFADELLAGLDTLDRWPEKVRLMQKNWIGRSEGLRFQFDLVERREAGCLHHPARHLVRRQSSWRCRRIIRWRRNWRRRMRSCAAFIAECRQIGTAEAEIEKAEKLGYDTGLTAAHPFDADWKLPVMVANFVLMGYGTGAIFGCPAHDQRDLDFARKYELAGAAGGGADRTPIPRHSTSASEAYVGPGQLANSRFLDGMDGGSRPRPKSPRGWKRPASASAR